MRVSSPGRSDWTVCAVSPGTQVYEDVDFDSCCREGEPMHSVATQIPQAVQRPMEEQP